MGKYFDAVEVADHNSPESCWVALYGDVWDVTKFLPNHPGGSRIILKLAGRDATEDYDPIHPPGTLEENLDPSCKLGRLNSSTVSPETQNVMVEEQTDVQSLLNLNEIEEVATKQISRKAWAYYFSASDDQITKSLNSSVYKSILLRPSVFVDCTKCSLDTKLLGLQVGTPIFVSPAAMARLAHPTGERGIARGISSFGAVQVVSNNASMTPETIVEDSPHNQVFGWQLYVQKNRRKSEEMLRRINKMGTKYKFIVLTLDASVPGKRELDERQSYLPISSAGKQSKSKALRSNGNSSKSQETETTGGLGKQLFQGTAADLTWTSTLRWLAQHTTLPIVLKGIQTHEDAYMAVQHFPQVRGIILSNHGGRALDTAPPPVHTLLEIRKYCPEVLSRVDVWIDGGIKRGTDVIKALCLGARAVGLGRAALYGLGAGGEEGVKRTFEILHAEMETCMRLLGVERIEDLGMRHINARAVERDIYDGPPNLKNHGLWASSKL